MSGEQLAWSYIGAILAVTVIIIIWSGSK